MYCIYFYYAVEERAKLRQISSQKARFLARSTIHAGNKETNVSSLFTRVDSVMWGDSMTERLRAPPQTGIQTAWRIPLWRRCQAKLGMG